jgi:Protein of unknown function (DUF3152)
MRLLRRGGPILTGRRIPGRIVIAAIVLLAFGVGVGAGWGSAVVAGFFVSALPKSDPSMSPSVTTSGHPNTDIPVDLYPALTRFMNSDDRDAGLTSLAIPVRGNGNLVVVPGESDPVGAGPTRWVRIEIEDGVPLDPGVVTSFVMSILGDVQGWTTHGRVSFGRTDGVADIRIVFASPKTAADLCSRPHDAAVVDIAPPDVPGGVPLPSASPSPAAPVAAPSASPSASPEKAPSCAEQGIVVVSAYQWAAGSKAFGDEAAQWRDYLINHPIGHLLGEPDALCGGTGQLAPIMQNQELDITPCEPNGWPFPASSAG